MIRILFVCHGNICRSPMAEFVFKSMVKDRGLSDQFLIASAATSAEELGNPVHRGTKKLLAALGISTAGKVAIRLHISDYQKYDFIIGMDGNNLRNMLRLFGSDPNKKLHLLLDYTRRPGNIADPWYTDDFEATYRDVSEGCEGLLQDLARRGRLR